MCGYMNVYLNTRVAVVRERAITYWSICALPNPFLSDIKYTMFK